LVKVLRFLFFDVTPHVYSLTEFPVIALFFIASAIAIISTFMVITRLDPVHALLYLVVSLLSIALIFYLLGASFVAALEVIIYAGAIMVLFIFVVMMLNLGPLTSEQERRWLNPGIWLGPTILSGILAIELVCVLAGSGRSSSSAIGVAPKQVSRSLFGPYLIAVELASILLMAGLVGAYHLGREWRVKKQ
jgi:NADH-quinone oxidoreductase subunit J